jgi:hypothetical protein
MVDETLDVDVVTKLLQYRFVEIPQVNGQVYRRAEAIVMIMPKEYISLTRGSVEA